MKKSLLLTLALALVLALCCVAASAESTCTHNGERQKINVTPATCTTDGKYDELCTLCNTTIAKDIKIPAPGHKVETWINTVNPTCSIEGEAAGKCSVCGNTVTKVLEKVECVFQWKTTTKPTCTAKGESSYVCVYCGGVKETKSIDMVPHQAKGDYVVDTPATCTTDGQKHLECKVCGGFFDYTVVKAFGHTANGDYVVDKAPTCTEAGQKHLECATCKQWYDYTAVEPTGHNWSDFVISTKETCTTDGWQYKYCTNPGCIDPKTGVAAVTEAGTRKALGHDTVTGKVKTAATCTEAGEKWDYCNRCKTWLEGTKSTIPALDHDWKNVEIIRKAQTCDTRLNYNDSKVGLILTKCSRCEKLGNKEYWLEHEVVNEVKPATCCTLGIDISYCKICGMIFHDYSTENYNLDNHDYEEYWAVVKEETCYSEGKYNVYCTGCSKLLREDTKAAVAHGTIMDNGYKTFVAGEGYSVAPTCEKVGKEVTICSKCYFSNGKVTVVSEKEIPATGHKWELDKNMSKEPTCRQTGINLYVCKNGCGATYEVELPKLEGHTWKKTPITAPKCGVAGINKWECTECNNTIWYEIVDAGEHVKDAGKVTTEPTCTTEGVMTYTCTLCGETFTEKIPATGHTMGDFVIIINPTCVDNGVETSKCKNCDYSEYRDVEATGHNYVCVNTVATCEVAGKNVYTCTRCGDSYTEVIPALGHNFETVITREPTATKDGEKADICTVCGAKTNVQVVEYVEMHFGCTMTLDGIQLNNLDAEQTAWNRVAVVDTTVDGTYTFNLVVDNKWTIGTATVTVANGTLTVTYKAGALKIKSETITVYDSLDALKADEGTVVKAGEAVAVSGNTAFIALNAIVNFDAGDYRVADYAEDAELIAEMKALIA